MKKKKITFVDPDVGLTSMRTTLGELLHAYRLGYGLTQTEVGDRIGVSRVAISLWERGKVRGLRSRRTPVDALATMGVEVKTA